jgi:uncharacterized protein YlxW (UPF0749 family)
VSSRPPADPRSERVDGHSALRALLGLDDEPAHAYGAGSRHEDDRTRSPGRLAPRTVTVLTALGALLVGFMLVAGLAAGRTSAAEQDARKEGLIELIEARQVHTETLTEELEDLRERVTAAESRAAGGRSVLNEQMADLEAATGLTAVAGPGLRLTLADGPEDCSVDESDCRIQDTDLQLAVNTLFAAGAEAVSINEERVIATTAIRRAGRQMMVNYSVLTSPYQIEAVGNPERLELEVRRSEFGRDFTIWQDVFGLSFDIEGDEELIVPHHSGSLGVETATPAEPLENEDAAPGADT